MVSSWLIVTLSATVISSALVIAIVYVLLKNSEKEERAADEVYLRQKQDLLKLAVDDNLKGSTGVLQVQSGNILKNANDAKSSSTRYISKLAGLIARQKAAIRSMKQKYDEERRKLKSS